MRYNRRFVGMVAMVLSATVLVGGCSFGSKDVGVIDAQKVMADSVKLKQLQEKSQEQFYAKYKELSDQLAQAQGTVSEEEFQKKLAVAKDEMTKLQKDQESQSEAVMKPAFEQVMKEKNLSAIIYKSKTVQGGKDVTDDIIKLLQ